MAHFLRSKWGMGLLIAPVVLLSSAVVVHFQSEHEKAGRQALIQASSPQARLIVDLVEAIDFAHGTHAVALSPSLPFHLTAQGGLWHAAYAKATGDLSEFDPTVFPDGQELVIVHADKLLRESRSVISRLKFEKPREYVLFPILVRDGRDAFAMYMASKPGSSPSVVRMATWSKATGVWALTSNESVLIF